MKIKNKAAKKLTALFYYNINLMLSLEFLLNISIYTNAVFPPTYFLF